MDKLKQPIFNYKNIFLKKTELWIRKHVIVTKNTNINMIPKRYRIMG